MKKLAAAILALVYLSTSAGAMVHFHYCMGRLVSWSLQDNEDRNCHFCGMPKQVAAPNAHILANNCCRDMHHHLKAGNDQKIASFPSLAGKIAAIAPVSHFYYGYRCLPLVAADNPQVHGPPGRGQIPVFLLHRSFRI